MEIHLRLFRSTKNKFIMHFYPYFSLEKWALLGFFAFFGLKSLPKNGPKVKNAPLREVFRELYIVEFWLLNHTLPEHKKQVYNAFWCIFDPYFFAWKMGMFGIFRTFWAKITKNQNHAIFKRLTKVQLFIFLRLKIFSPKNFGTLEHFCTLFHFLTPKTQKSRGGSGGSN